MDEDKAPEGTTEELPDEDIESLADVLLELFTKEDGTPASSSESGGKPEGASAVTAKTPGEATDTPPEDSAPPAPARTLDLTSPEAAEFLDTWYTQRTAAEERQRSATESLEELEGLVKEGKYEELGQRFVEEYQGAKAKRQVGGEVLNEFLYNTYTKIFSDPVFQSLTPEEQAEIQPGRFNGSDAEYISFLSDFKAKKLFGKTEEEVVEAKVKERVEALRNQQRGQRLSGSSPTNLPPSAPGEAPEDDSNKSGLDLISEGLREAYEEFHGGGRNNRF